MKVISPKEMAAVIAAPDRKRYDHFIKQVVAWEEAWGLYQDGWALAATNDDGTTVFPLWPAKEYAQICAEKEWKEYKPRSISLNDFMEVLLPKLKSDGILPAIFYTPSNKGLTPSVDEVKAALEAEMQNY